MSERTRTAVSGPRVVFWAWTLLIGSGLAAMLILPLVGR